MEVIRIKVVDGELDAENIGLPALGDYHSKKVIKLNLSNNWITSVGNLSNISHLNLNYNCLYRLNPIFNIPALEELSLIDAIGYPGRISESNVGVLRQPVLSRVSSNIKVLILGNLSQDIIDMILSKKSYGEVMIDPQI